MQNSLEKLNRVNEKFQLKFKGGKCPGGWVEKVNNQEQDLEATVDSCLRTSTWCVAGVQKAHGNYLERTECKTEDISMML